MSYTFTAVVPLSWADTVEKTRSALAGQGYEQFEAEMEKVINSPSAVYQAQVREIYTLGLFLAHKKYRYLRLAYATSISGLFASFITLLLTSKS